MAPHGYTVTKPAISEPNTVTFHATDEMPAVTPTLPVACTTVTDPATRRPAPADLPSTVEKPGLVSINRATATGTNPPSSAATATPPPADATPIAAHATAPNTSAAKPVRRRAGRHLVASTTHHAFPTTEPLQKPNMRVAVHGP